jgi:phage I-like protein
MDTLYARFRESLPLDAPREGGPVWTHMVPADGRVPGFVRVPAGHEIPGRGTSDKPADVECVTIFNRQVLESILQSFGNEILVDYEHFSHDPDKSTEAAGWGREVRMSARGDGVEIEVEWTAPAREKIVSGVYRYISPEFDGRLELVDGTLCFFPTRVTGAGLTNRPKLTMLRPVSANRNTQHTPTMDKALQLLCGLIGCADSATPEELAQAVDAYKQRVSALEAENQSFKDGQIEADMKANEDVIGKCRDEQAAERFKWHPWHGTSPGIGKNMVVA